ncbi:hypothetical protein AC1031_017713 [Aphanomyces cochlioides]|nr:hypothetical protein AC1031_017713 [Aphanomyces cochlioides]
METLKDFPTPLMLRIAQQDWRFKEFWSEITFSPSPPLNFDPLLEGHTRALHMVKRRLSAANSFCLEAQKLILDRGSHYSLASWQSFASNLSCGALALSFHKPVIHSNFSSEFI